MFSLAGYASFQVIIDSTQDKHPLEDVVLPCPPCPSDIDKCQKIAGKIVGNTRVDKDRNGRWKINKASIDFLNPIRCGVISILTHQFVKDAIKYTAESLYKQGEMSGARIKGLEGLIDSILSEVNIESEVKKHCQQPSYLR